MTPRLGEFFVVRTDDLAGAAIRAVTHSTVNHAGVYVGHGMIVEAQPGGACLTPASVYRDATWSGPGITQGQGHLIAQQARSHIGDPYSWVDCACIGLTDLLGWHVPGAVRDRLENPHRNMCSQLVDRAYADAGVHLFTDGRIPGDVSPEDLRALIAGP